jgi:hypothetical protein
MGICFLIPISIIFLSTCFTLSFSSAFKRDYFNFIFCFSVLGLNPGPHTCWANTLSLELHPSPSVFIWLLRQGLINFVQASLKLSNLLSGSWDYRHIPPCPSWLEFFWLIFSSYYWLDISLFSSFSWRFLFRYWICLT